MVLLLKKAGIALAATMSLTLLGTAGSSAAAEYGLANPIFHATATVLPTAAPLGTDPRSADQAETAIAPVPTPAPPTSEPAIVVPEAPAPVAAAPTSLEQLVAAQSDVTDVTDELKCLAGAIYFEARSESLEGQLAVGRVIVARTRSGRFPASYCGVVFQHSQFSFIRGQAMPSVDAQSRLWQRAMALARIARAGSWQSPAEGALFFHAARVSDNGRMTRVAQIDHHIFYR